MEVRNCNIEMHAGPKDAHIELVADLHQIIIRQLDLLEIAHANLKPSDGDIIGIKMEGTSGAVVTGSSISSKVRAAGSYY
jgi:hypothetical protein